MDFRKYFGIVLALPKTIYFNFHYLPVKSAIKLPIVFMSGIRLVSMKGKISFSTPIFTGMVKFGGGNNPLYKQTNYKCVWADFGGDIVFGKTISFCQGTALEIGEEAKLVLGNKVYFGALSKLACYEKIEIGENTRFSWENIIVDTDFHSIINVSDGSKRPMCSPIKIGKFNWFGIQSLVLKGTKTPDYCMISARSLVNKEHNIPSYTLLGGIPAKLLKEGVYRDFPSHVNLKSLRNK